MKKAIALVVVLLGSLLVPTDFANAKTVSYCQPTVKISTCDSARYNNILGWRCYPVGQNITVNTSKCYVVKCNNKMVWCQAVPCTPSVPKTPDKHETKKPAPVVPDKQEQEPTPTVPSDRTSDTEEQFSDMQKEMLNYINAARAKVNAAPLTLDAKLCEGAYLKSKDMAEKNYFDHNSPTYGTPFEMMKKLGISFKSAGENIAKNISVKGAHEAFMNSSGHRANILSTQYTKVGLGFYQKGQYLYVTQWFTN